MVAFPSWRRLFGRLALATIVVAGATIAGSARGAEPLHPNIVFILTDDHVPTEFGCYGNSEAKTPNIDALAAGGARFTNAMVVCPMCAPSRVCLMTGQYPGRFYPNPNNLTAGVPSGQPTLQEILKSAGYRTGFVGKAHFRLPGTGSLEDQLKGIGFTWVSHAHGYRYLQDAQHDEPRTFASACSFIAENKERPFALFVFTRLTHSLAVAPPKFMEGVRASQGRAAVAAWLDSLIGDVVRTLDESGLRERTAIILASDNASSGGGEGENKCTLYEGRVPLVVSWPARIKASQVVDAVVQNIDFLPTILEICEVPIPPGTETDGASFLPLMTGKAAEWRKAAFFEFGWARSVRTARWKYIAIRDPRGNASTKQTGVYGGAADLLFDLQADPSEKKNLFEDPAHAGIVKEMQGLLRAHCATYDYPFGDFGGGPPPPRH
ncbi:MAG: sulfatase-like hydrolase/transferase [Planctomycetales bacterium]